MADIATNTLQIGGNNLILQDAAVRSSLSNAYSASSTYAVGDMVLKDGQLYECNTAISTAEAWTAAHWTAVTVGEKIADLEAETNTLKEEYTQIFDSAYVTDTASGSVASFPDGADNVTVMDLKVNVEPVQDLHGYDNPWSAGGGKNLLNNTATTKTTNGVTFTVNSDGTITANGTATADAQIQIGFSGLSGNYKFTGCPSGGGSGKYDVYAWDSTTNTRPKKWNGTTESVGDFGNTLQEIQIPSGHSGVIVCRVSRNYTANNIVFKPMIVASTVSDITYAPYENICPITGHTQAKVTRTGKNFVSRPTWQTFTKSGITATVLDDGRVSVSGTGTNTGFDIITFSQFLLPAGSYIFNGQNGVDSTNKKLTLQLYDKGNEVQLVNRDTATDFSFTLTKETLIEIRIGLRVGISVTNAIMSPMIRLATDTDATYEPYSGQQYTIDLGGTIYGGDLDVPTGTLTNKSEYKTLSTSNWTRLYDDQCVYYSTDQSKAIGANNIISDMFKTDKTRSNNSISGSASTRGIYVRDDSCTTLEEFKTKYPTVNVLFERATSQIVQLSANEVKTLLGQNSIWNDCGDTAVEYRADTKLYIEKLTAPTEDDMIADHAISANSFFMVGNTLYRATTAIASGATITVGTNATKLSLSDALNALA